MVFLFDFLLFIVWSMSLTNCFLVNDVYVKSFFVLVLVYWL